MKNIYLTGLTAWAPALHNDEKLWQDWASGKIQIEQTKESPKLEFTTPLFRRRLSQITKMTVQVVHQLLETAHPDKQTKLVFISQRGEIQREAAICQGLVEEQQVLPAAFSLSVFNTPISTATLAFNLKAGYSVIFPSKNNFKTAFQTASAPVLASTEKEIILVYADELVPDIYGSKIPQDNTPLAFAAILTSEKKANSIQFDDFSNIPESPSEFLKLLIN